MNWKHFITVVILIYSFCKGHRMVEDFESARGLCQTEVNSVLYVTFPPHLFI